MRYPEQATKMYSDMDFKASARATRWQQPWSSMAAHRLLPAVLLMALLTGCGSVPASINPVDWWHDLQGGKIAEQRPPPPGATDPYPNLSTVPVRPAFIDPDTRNRITEGLVADRANAQYEQAQAPLADPGAAGNTPPPLPTKPPATTATPTAATSDPPAASASLAAASAPPARPAAPIPPVEAPVPAGPVSTIALLPPTARGETASGAALPPLPQGPPLRPSLPGFPAAAGAPVAVDRMPAATPAQSGGEVPIAFTRGSARLDATGIASLRSLLARRGAAVIVVVGRGEVASPTPEAQYAALVLALLRAQAMVAALTQAGAPPAAMIVDAQVAGRGAAARLLD